MIQLEKTLTSLEVAEMVGREHRSVIRDIRTIIEHIGGEHKTVQSYFIESTYTNSQNKTLPNFLLTKKGCELYSTRMTGEKGTQFAMKYIERFNKMENHIKKEIDTSQLSPELQMFKQIFDSVAQTQIKQSEQDKRIETVEKNQNNIKEVLSITTHEWRKDVKRIINTVARANGGTYQATWNKVYSDLEIRGRCDLNRRLENMKDRASKAGAPKKEISSLSNLDIIDRDQKLKEIFLAIIKEFAIKHGVDAS